MVLRDEITTFEGSPSRRKMKLGQGSNSKSIRSHNEKTVLHLLRYLKTASRNDLAHYTDLTSQSLRIITDNLVQKRLIVNVGKKSSKIGQPPFLYSLNPDAAYSIGCNVDRRFLEMVLVNFLGEVCDRRVVDYSFPIVNTVVDAIKDFIAYCDKSDKSDKNYLGKTELMGVGIGTPNFLGSWKKELEGVTDFQEWDQSHFQERLKQELRCPVYFENDMNAATMAAMIKGNGNSMSNFIYFYLGTFVGGGVVMDGKIIKGEKNNAGNFGTLLVSVSPSSAIYDPSYPNPCQLLSYVSINHLKKLLSRKGIKVPSQDKDFFKLLDSFFDNSREDEWVNWMGLWLEEISLLLAQATLQVSSILDIPYVIFDSPLNRKIVGSICEKMKRNYSHYDNTGITLPEIVPGDLGGDARALGSALVPVYEQYIPNEFNARGSLPSLRMKNTIGATR